MPTPTKPGSRPATALNGARRARCAVGSVLRCTVAASRSVAGVLRRGAIRSARWHTPGSGTSPVAHAFRQRSRCESSGCDSVGNAYPPPVAMNFRTAYASCDSHHNRMCLGVAKTPYIGLLTGWRPISWCPQRDASAVRKKRGPGSAFPSPECAQEERRCDVFIPNSGRRRSGTR